MYLFRQGHHLPAKGIHYTCMLTTMYPYTGRWANTRDCIISVYYTVAFEYAFLLPCSLLRTIRTATFFLEAGTRAR